MRKIPFGLLMLVLATTPAIGQSGKGAPPGEWRQFRGSAQLTGVSAGAPPATLKQLWSYKAGALIDSSAAVADGAVYVGEGDGDLLALDLASGKLRWRYKTGNLIGESSP